MKKIYLIFTVLTAYLNAQAPGFAPTMENALRTINLYHELINTGHGDYKNETVQFITINAKNDTSIRVKKFNQDGRLYYESTIKNGQETVVYEAAYLDQSKIVKNLNRRHDIYCTLQKDYEKGKVRNEWRKSFNQYGLLTQEVYLRKGKEVRRTENNYLNDSTLTEIKQYRNGALTKRTERIYNNQNKVKEMISYDQRDKEIYRKKSFYNSNNKTIHDSIYKKGQLLSYSLRNYDESGKLLSETKYNKKNKVILINHYECNPIGEITKKVKQSAECVYRKEMDGYLVKVQEFRDEKGIWGKKVYKYRASDTALVNIRDYNSKNELIASEELDPNSKATTAFKVYKKGKETKSTLYTYSDGQLSQVQSYSKGQLDHILKIYYENGEVSKVEEYNANNELVVQRFIERDYK